jgi:hypothetical protein
LFERRGHLGKLLDAGLHVMMIDAGSDGILSGCSSTDVVRISRRGDRTIPETGSLFLKQERDAQARLKVESSLYSDAA